MKRNFTMVACATALLAGTAGAKDIEMQSIFPQSLPLLGKPAWDVSERVDTLTAGGIKFDVKAPGEIVSTGEVWDSVSTGAVESSWYSIGFAEGVVPAAPLFTTFPFGPDIKEYAAWWYYGGGQDKWSEMTESQYNIKTIHCSTLVPEASGWFRDEIKTLDDLKGKKMRFFGLGASVMGKMGVEAQSMGLADTMSALNTGAIDSAELGFPFLDNMVGMYDHAKHYYFPGWHQQTSFLSVIINLDTWNDLSDQERAIIETACEAQVLKTMAEGEAVQLEPLAKMQAENGVIVHEWPAEILDAYESAWTEVAAEKSAADADFKSTWESIQTFRKDYSEWKNIGYLK
ncbi:TRAP transporter substrate-binding protein [Neptunicoccus cionae]|uniref:ABC transporter substrate-binding protein n=1 Tax=Neptunicoccus cionae TaxID=2035344 RepID=A0A916R0L7_9RHOB|nr:TRAP transporter substrate-binding protein [Amylibacter cionae]GGA25896.1 ABC transporter substrate-binding protein [Amylibacter cionae]